MQKRAAISVQFDINESWEQAKRHLLLKRSYSMKIYEILLVMEPGNQPKVSKKGCWLIDDISVSKRLIKAAGQLQIM